MPQLQLPVFYEGVNPITNDIGYEKQDDTVVYFCGTMPVYSHGVEDLDSFRSIVSQLYVNGNAGQSEIARAFDIQPQALKRWVKRFRQSGPRAFYEPRKTRGKATVLTAPVREKAQARLEEGWSVSAIARELEIGYDVVRKAIGDGRLTRPAISQKKAPR